MSTITNSEKNKYSKYLSTLFSSATIVALSILCLVNNMTIDIYSMIFLIKIVIPATICNWIIGYVVGIILESGKLKTIKKKLINEEKAYAIPSIFLDNTQQIDENYINNESISQENDI